ncbi:hypothetical protein FHS19_005788 [Paenibacillus rhizosphaerae]|uniref:Uncharacterized protein n=1 Tax=Paenibacillus rhizosphaerae TaxID=297318 RepID=A0A839U097_9BACL|nr:hypothetical protein [Paenibacillus rhizosphaerae]
MARQLEKGEKASLREPTRKQQSPPPELQRGKAYGVESLRAAFEAVFLPPHLIKEHGFNSGWNPKCALPRALEVWVSCYSFESTR